MKKKLLVIGGTGFLGYHFAKNFLKKNYTVTIVSLTKPKKNRVLKSIKYIQCDISKTKDIKKKINKDFDYVFNFSGHVDHKNKKKTMLSHYTGVKNICSHLTKEKLKLFVQIGSGLEYGKNTSPQIEIKKCFPISSYAKSKYFGSKHLLNLHKSSQFPCVIVRAYQVYGPRQDNNRLIPFVINECLKEESFPCSNGEQFRDFIYIDDFVIFLKKILANKNKCKGQIFNIGVGKSFNIKNIINSIKDKIKKGNPKFGLIKLRKEESQNVFPNINKAKRMLNWKPKVSLDQGLSKTINYYRKFI